jgi:23S rRNA (pseudouridine1915-N3)-methyltransferase
VNLLIAAVGRLKQGPERDLARHYAERIEAAGRSVALTPLEIAELPEGRAATSDLRKADEAGRLLGAAAKAEVIVALDETGKTMTSRAFADFLRSKRDGGCARMAFALGGPDGHGAELKSKAGLILSLGAMTLPHGLARIVLSEQLYRAVTIIGGHPYHRD